MVVFNDRVFLTDSLSLVTFDRALALSKSHLENRHIHRRFMARSARSSVLSGDDYPEQFKLEVFQQTEINVDAAPGVEVRAFHWLRILTLFLMIPRKRDKFMSTATRQSDTIFFVFLIIAHTRGLFYFCTILNQ